MIWRRISIESMFRSILLSTNEFLFVLQMQPRQRSKYSRWSKVIGIDFSLCNWNLFVFYIYRRHSTATSSTRSQVVIYLIIAPYRTPSDLAEIDQKMPVSDHYPVHWRLSSFQSHSRTKCEVKIIDWVVLNCILNLKQHFFFALSRTDEASIDRVDSCLRGIPCCLTGKMYRLSHNQKLSTPVYLPIWWILSSRDAEILCLYRSSLYSLNKYIHHKLRAVMRAQWQVFCLELGPKNTQRFRNHSKKLFQGKSNSNSRVSRWAKPSSDNQCRCHHWTCSSILLGGLQRKGNLLGRIKK